MQKVLLVFLCLAFIGACNNAETTSDPGTTLDPQIEAINQRIEENPKQADLYYARSQAWQGLGDIPKSLKDITRAIQLDSMKPVYYHYMSDLHRSSSNFPAAIESLQAALHFVPNDRSSIFKLGRLYLETEQHQLADEEFLKLLKEDQLNSDAWFFRGMVKKDQGDTSTAIRFFKRAAETNSQNFEAYMQLGQIFYNQKDPLALLYFKNAERVEPENLDPIFNQAHFQRRRGNFSEAKELYKKIVIRDPQNVKVHRNLAYVELELNNFAAAARSFKRATKFEPANANNHFGLGLSYDTLASSYLSQGYLDSAETNWRRAKLAFENAIGLNDQDQESYLRLTRIAKKLEQNND